MSDKRKETRGRILQATVTTIEEAQEAGHPPGTMAILKAAQINARATLALAETVEALTRATQAIAQRR